MKIAGIILTVIGAVGLIISGINYANQTDKLNLLGAEITVSEGSITPIIITGVIFFIGLIMVLARRK